MAKKRIPIPDDLAAEVLFFADRTCCVCREPDRKVQIHHIDEDPSHNTLENLATLCGDCHSDAHTTHAFARNLSALVIGRYNETWRDIVRARLTMPSAIESERVEYSAEILQEVQWLCLRWLNRLLHLVPEDFYADDVNRTPWLAVTAQGFPTFSHENYQRYLPLFEVHTVQVADLLERLVATFGDALPTPVKLGIFRTSRGVRMEAHAYRCLLITLKGLELSTFEISFQRRFIDTAMRLRHLSELSERHRKKLFPNESAPPGAFNLAA